MDISSTDNMKNLILIVLFLCTVVSTQSNASVHKHKHTHTSHVSTIVSAKSYLILDVTSGETIAGKAEFEQRSIASITKLFLASTVLIHGQDLEEKLLVAENYGLHSRLPTNEYYTRRQLLTLSLMSSDNLATKVLAINYPGGETQAILAMNQLVQSISLRNTEFYEVTGLDERNKSTAKDVANFLHFANATVPNLMEFTSNADHTLEVRGRTIEYHNTNPLVKTDSNIIISKTGFTNPAGRCLAMFIKTEKTTYAVVLLNDRNKPQLIADALTLIKKIEMTT
jgi:D-alanyl-D-alanine endopeptidase (penicillin-binding protein 7)